jgi:hypothetical protein
MVARRPVARPHPVPHPDRAAHVVAVVAAVIKVQLARFGRAAISQ